MTGTWKNGHVILDAPANWPEGCRVTVEPAKREQVLGIRDEEWPTDSAGLAQLLAQADEIEPFDMTAEEEAEFWAWKQKIKEYTLANMAKDVEAL